MMLLRIIEFMPENNPEAVYSDEVKIGLKISFKGVK